MLTEPPDEGCLPVPLLFLFILFLQLLFLLSPLLSPIKNFLSSFFCLELLS